MPNILTPVSLWESFTTTPDVPSEVLTSAEEDGVTIETVRFGGRVTQSGRVSVAAAYAYDAKSPAKETVIVFPDSKDTIDRDLIKMFVRHGYSALMVDYRGVWEGCDFYTRYPEEIAYANFAESGRYYGYVDDSAVETSWYEWVAVGIYAKKYVSERNGSGKIAVVGLRDGGEIAWKLAIAVNLECIIPVCAAGWRAYAGINKYLSSEPDLNEERYRFIAGIDSQAYAPYVRCPVLMLCSTNDARFDYDRAYDTFSRINPEFISESAIAFSVQCNGCISVECTADMFMFLDKNLKSRQVFVPKPAEISVEVDAESNLVARVIFDNRGIVEESEMFMAEDCVDSVMREWTSCPPKTKINAKEQTFYLNLYEKTSTVFVLCYVRYINGFTVWSKVSAKKISGKFRNMQAKCRVMYSDKDGAGTFSNATPEKCAIGGIFFSDLSVMPSVVEISDGVRGLQCADGLTTFRLNNPKFSPVTGNLLKMDVFCEKTADVKLVLFNMNTGEEYIDIHRIIGGVWQSITAECGLFKNANGAPLASFASYSKFSILCDENFAVNNIMWL